MKLLCLDQHQAMATALSSALGAEQLPLEQRHFPDGELYFNLPADVSGEDIVLLCHLHQPNDPAMAIWFLARHLRDMGAGNIILVAPYLAYMRQDIRFQPGECLTSKYFAELISQAVDGLTTIDPHLHRYNSLDEIYRIPSRVLHATDAIGDYLRTLAKPLVIGPDAESEQWATAVANAAGCDYLVLNKQRSGDREVAIDVPDIRHYQQHTPVLVDDIVSTGRTMLRTAEQLVQQGLPKPLCIAVHAVFAEGAEQEMRAGPIADIVSCDCIPHPSNRIATAGLLAPAINDLMDQIRRSI
ncbi:phosphoribosylpyrophosphate synthetase [Bacterioplanes sanyensis]|uniref:ribose-phosphate diphosphokinase n=1 Tax=Bacterioplanes sanyensis TaxID=1249553 RepID=UPI0016797924|nr:ribose-phosphate diphosphokinase [Bacterioplanes sanyensis]GGY37652.1 phosphoribosylpyrophosphate synthetase [Bacterioplanes sanyensis]